MDALRATVSAPDDTFAGLAGRVSPAATVEGGLLGRLIASLDVGIILQAHDGDVLACNAAAERICGLTSAQMSNRAPRPPGWAALHDDGWPLPKDLRPPYVALRSGRPCHVVVGIKRSDGVTWAAVSSQPLFRDGEARPYAVASSLTDISEARRAQAAERRGADRFRSLIEYSSDVITILDERGRVTYASPSVEKVLGYAPGEVHDADHLSFVHEDDSATVASALATLAVRPGASSSYEYRLRAKDGSWRIAESVATNRLHDPAVTGIVVNTRDITERRDAEAALKASNSRLQKLVENLPAGVLVEDTSRRVVLANAAFCSIFGIDAEPDDLAGREVPRDAHCPAELPAARRPALGWEIALPDGRTLARDYMPITVDDGDSGHLWIFRDITARKEVEEEAARVRDEAIRASRVKSEFLATVSHEIRTPMNGVLGTIDLLLDTALSAEQDELATVVRDSAHSLLGIIDDLLDLSKIEAEKLVPKEVEFDLTDVAEGVADVVMPSVRRKDLLLTTYVDPHIDMPLCGDPQWIRQVLLNLAGNAVKFTDEGAVEIRAELEALTDSRATVRLAVTDTGAGIPEEARERLFEPFSQLDSTSTRRHGGTGLGLAISQRLVRLMGGDLEVHSEPGHGATFSFALDLGRPRSPREPRGPAPRPLRVLLALACDATAAVAQDYLRAWDMPVERVAGGAEALSAAADAAEQGRPFDVAIVGTALTEPAEAVAAALRARHGRERPAVVLLRDVAAPAPEHGRFAAELTKPLKRARLLEAVVAAADPGTIDPARRTGSLTSRLAGTRALVAEDNDVNRELLLRQLAKLGVEATGVASGREAIEAAAASGYDVLLMDCHMPEVDGFEAARAIRAAEGGGRRMPIVAVTASTLAEDREACLAAGMDECLTKPVTTAAIAAAIEPCLDARRGALDTAMLDELADELGGGAELARLLDLFKEHLPSAERLIVAAVEKEDPHALARAAHRLRSSSASFGAHRLAQLSSRLEELGRSGSVEGACALAGELRQECAAVRRELAARVGG